MSLLTIQDLTLRIAGRPLLEGACATIDPGRKVGLVGPNGAGKSTLLNAISGSFAPDGGDITLARRARLGHVRQEAPAGAQSVIETVLAADTERAALLAEEASNPTLERLADIHERLAAIDAYGAPARAATILAGLGFDEAAQNRPVSSFSGGWRMRISLAGGLFAAPDLLLLDEPTNHLDLEATLWLEGWLQRYPGTILMVSHDRALLDGVADSIMHLDKGKLSLTPGGFERFVRIKTEQALQQNRAAAKMAAQREKMEAFVARFRAKATKAKQAQARLKALARMPVLESVIEATPVRFEFPSPEELPPPMLRLEGASAGYGEHVVLSHLSLRLDGGDRIGLLGRNGEGKSTFAKLLADDLQPMGGEVARAPKLRVGYFAQHQAEALHLDQTPIEHMQAALPEADMTGVRAQLARFGLDAERAETQVGQLSGGEKARLLLALATRHAPHLLILDEPTNHLDLDARDALIRALNDFEGAVLIISHDARLIEAATDRFLIAADGRLTPFEGDMKDYRQWLLERERAARAEAAAKGAPTSASKSGQGGAQPSHAEARAKRKENNRALMPLKREIRTLEALMEKLQSARAVVEGKLAAPELYESGDGTKITALNKELAALDLQLGEAETTWLERQDELERSQAPSQEGPQGSPAGAG
ncbi:ABC-F family ATP-binding cassette domain-containing protein [Formicincola oecophyllae]|uniref:Probable ATP-binding protein YheS n=1 Tax=Formicincola oecophyllae TaxID=2558361 RepID=A0A4Y6U907_9PROT|nr:ABC-F family ATP-binding cassette domain-containing protein [Formicincola oecophyllae]QDH13939.1 ABC-F family ATP-binding cassette domain-containing protein [Formicincola oecophyllae]